MNNQSSGLSGLLQSRRFVLAVLDAVLTLGTYFISKYLGVALEDWKYAVLVLQPILIMVIIAITVDDNVQRTLVAQRELYQMTLDVQSQPTLTMKP